jgi:hypothetical protein
VTFVEFWGVGAATASILPMTTDDICGHLIADWVPSLPVAVGSSFVGWPPFLIELLNRSGNDLLALRTEAGRSERQWKSVLSWMLGVAGARQVLKNEGYRWVAPLSAFYPGAAQTVDLSAWNPSFPRSVITASRPSNSRFRLMPDYLALKSTRRQPGRFEWAVVEAKGTRGSLTNRTVCPQPWSNQVRNVLVTVQGARLTIPRHLVIATRVNPNGVHTGTRRIQVRAWNNTTEPEDHERTAAVAVEIVAAHLFGLFRGLRLLDYSRAIAFSSQMRIESREEPFSEPRRQSIRAEALLFADRAEAELTQRAVRPVATTQIPVDSEMLLETEFGPIKIDLSKPLMNLVRGLCRAETSETADEILLKGDSELDMWEPLRREAAGDHAGVVLPFGVELRLPAEFGRR